MPNISTKRSHSRGTVGSSRTNQTSSKNSFKTVKISKFFAKKESDEDLSDSPYKNCLSDVKTALDNSNDLDDFKTPQALNKVSKLTQVKKEKNVKKRKKSVQVPLHKFFEDNFKHTDCNPDHLQMALAMSESSYECENPNSQEKKDSFRKAFEKYGFGYSKNKISVETKKEHSKNKKSRYRYVTPILKIRTQEEREELISSKVSLILAQNSKKSVGSTGQWEELDVCSPSLKEFIGWRIFQLNCSSLSDLNKEGVFYVSGLGIEPSPASCGCLLKDWRRIPGREPTPERETDKIEGFIDVGDETTSPTLRSLVNSPSNEGVTKVKSPEIMSSGDSVIEITSPILETETNIADCGKTREPTPERETNNCLRDKMDGIKSPILGSLPGGFIDVEDETTSPVLRSFLNSPSNEGITKIKSSEIMSSGDSVIEITSPILGTETNIADCGKTREPTPERETNNCLRDKMDGIKSPILGSLTGGFIDVGDETTSPRVRSLVNSRSNESVTKVKSPKPEITSSGDSVIEITSPILETQTNIKTLQRIPSKYRLSPDITQPDLGDLNETIVITPPSDIVKSPMKSKTPQKCANKRSFECVSPDLFESDDECRSVIKNSGGLSTAEEMECYDLTQSDVEENSFHLRMSGPEDSIDQRSDLNVTEYVTNLLTQQKFEKISTSGEDLSQGSVDLCDEELNYSSVFGTPHLRNVNLSDEESKENNITLQNSFEEDLTLEERIKSKWKISQQPLEDSFKDVLEQIEAPNKSEEDLPLEERIKSKRKTPQQPLEDSFNDVLEQIETPNKSENDNFLIKTSNVTPMANYDEMDTPKIVKELDKFGLKPLKRQKGAKLLRYIYDSTHPVVEDDDGKVLKKRRTRLEYPQSGGVIIEDLVEEEDLIFERTQSKKIASCRVPLHIVWFNFVMSNPKIRESILLYEPLQLEVLHGMIKGQGFKFNIQDLLSFLDKKCITIRTAQGTRNVKTF